MKSNVAVIGSRGFGDYALLSAKLGEYEIGKIVSGGARGADSLAARFARERGLELQEFLPDYKKYGRGAPLVRNKLIVDAADMVVSFGMAKAVGPSLQWIMRRSKGNRWSLSCANRVGGQPKK